MASETSIAALLEEYSRFIEKALEPLKYKSAYSLSSVLAAAFESNDPCQYLFGMLVNIDRATKEQDPDLFADEPASSMLSRLMIACTMLTVGAHIRNNPEKFPGIDLGEDDE